ncbi:subunit beta of coatomer complex [Hamiltosporidium tvaerminnensis]|uniref:Coatomer subunit beta n=1 Tax=Hamiltosporidium tvaerminnensis TaxID=1176355 RepID=A0A4Q9L3W6_9MICR|nr:subunit beta of coatomer complex [Hamiltosporidium tvaerminnensis]
MTLTSIYINFPSYPLSLRKDLARQLQSSTVEDNIRALETIIILASQNQDFTDHLNLISRLMSVTQNKVLKSLFYKFLIMTPKTDSDGRILGEFLIITNQIRKDLTHPNEYLRSKVLQFIATLNSFELVENFIKPIQQNFLHQHFCVRRNAYFCITELYKKFGDTIPNVPQQLYDCLVTETDPNCLKQLYSSLLILDADLLSSFMKKQDFFSLPPELLEIIIEKNNDLDFISKFLNHSEPTVSYCSALKIISLTNYCVKKDFNLILKCIDVLIPYLSDQDFKFTTLRIISNVNADLSSFVSKVMEFIDSTDIIFSAEILNFVFKYSTASNFSGVSDNLIKNFNHSKKSEFIIFLIENMTRMLKVSGTTSALFLEIACTSLKSENPGLSHAALSLLKVHLKNNFSPKILNFLVYALKDFKFGKIIRQCTDIILEFGEVEDYKKMIEILYSGINFYKNKKKQQTTADKNNTSDTYSLITPNSTSRSPILFTLDNPAVPFLGPFFSLSIARMYIKIKNNLNENQKNEIKTKTLALLLEFMKMGEKENLMDLSGRYIITECIRTVINEYNVEKSIISDNKVVQKFNVLAPIKFNISKISSDDLIQPKTDIFMSSDLLDYVFQLTGFSDPVYCEANIKISRLDISLDILVVNQTTTILQNCNFDFVTSTNITQNFISAPFNLPEMSVKNILCSFKIHESLNCSISGTFSFSYSGMNRECGSESILNLSEIKFNVSDFLLEKSISEDEFREKWTKLEWENTYCLKFRSNMDINEIVERIRNKIKGKIVSSVGHNKCMAYNIVCGTWKGTLILLNIGIYVENGVGFECRIRSCREDVVKSLSSVVGECLKDLKEK